MKKSILLFGLALFAFAACSKSDKNPDGGKDNSLPSAASIEFIVDVNQETNEVTFSLPKDVTGLIPIWHTTNESGEFQFAGTGDNFKKVFNKKGEYKVRLFVSNSAGQSLDFAEKSFTIENDKAGESLTGGFVYDSEYNLWKAVDGNDAHTYSQFTATTDAWTALDNPEIIQSGNTYYMKYETETHQQWQAQFFIIPNEANAITLAAGKSYDFSCVIYSSKDLPGVTFKLTQGDSDVNFLFTSKRIEVKAGEPYVFWWADQPIEADIPNVKMVFDFGGCPAGSEITVGNIVLKDHANDDGTKDVPKREDEVPEDPNKGFVDEYDESFAFDLTAPANLWAASTVTVDKVFYAPAWAEIVGWSDYTVENGVYTLNYTAATDSRWQNQFHLQSTCAIEADKQYAITFTVESNQDHPGFFAKITNQADNNDYAIWETKTDIKVRAGEPRVFHATGIQGKDIPDGARLIFDFAPNAENTVVKIKDIGVQIYK